VAFFTGWLATQDHAEKFRGFVSSLSRINPGLKLGPIVEAHDDEAEADRRTREVLRAHPRLKALYISTSNSMPVLRAAARMGRLAGLTVVTTDLFPELAEMIRTGEVAATVYQRPLSQGRIALQALYQFLHGGRTPAAHQRVAPHLVMSSNLDLVLERLAGHPAAAAGDQSPPSLNVTPTVARQKLKSDSPRSSRSTSSSSPGSSSWSERK
jgi:LacI family transcriptional regulator